MVRKIINYKREIFSSCNISLTIYKALTHGAYATILAHGNETQKNTYLPKLVTCEWTGTMNLTEPHCGTDLGLIRTSAKPNGDAYSINGQKIFISCGEHYIADNIVHLVLAKLPDAPKGVKGISLFLVPKYNVNSDGTLGERNGVNCVSIEEKMGVHGSATCVMSFENAKGYLIGEVNEGLAAMFSMMNTERIAVGLQGLGQAEIAYQNGLAYAKERIQGRDLKEPRNPNEEADPLIVHPDVRRMLMRSKALIDSGRMLACWTALAIDKSEKDPDEKIRKEANDLVELMTPIIKALLTDYCV